MEHRITNIVGISRNIQKVVRGTGADAGKLIETSETIVLDDDDYRKLLFVVIRYGENGASYYCAELRHFCIAVRWPPVYDGLGMGHLPHGCILPQRAHDIRCMIPHQ